MKDNEIIKTEDLIFDYTVFDENGDETGKNRILTDINLSIEKGSFVAVLGHNGSGKSTLAKHMNAILVPDEGRVTVCGIDTAEEERVIDVRRNVGMVFQNPDNQIVATVVEEDVAFALENLGVPPAEMRARVDEAMQMAGIYKYREKGPHKLSGGQKQRVAIAGVLAMQPEILVMDEPTAMLDPSGRQEVLRTIADLRAATGVTVVLITHHMDEAVCADRVIAMDDGKIIADGTPKEVFVQIELLKRVGLTVPQTTLLLDALNQDGCALPLDALSVEECADAICHAFSGEK